MDLPPVEEIHTCGKKEIRNNLVTKMSGYKHASTSG